jgi:hypothetical protein
VRARRNIWKFSRDIHVGEAFSGRLAEFDFAFAPVAKLACPAYAMIRLEIQREL